MHVAEAMPEVSGCDVLETTERSGPPETNYSERITVRGKFLFLGKEKFWVKGVTYGTFEPDENGQQFPKPDLVRADFESMHSAGINTIRTYTRPPLWLLDLAQNNYLRVMVGLAWEQHVTFLDDPALLIAIENTVREDIRACRQHAAIFCYSIGNEIPASIVRWHGRRKIEKFIKRLYQVAKREDPAGLFTYVNYPTTEYLQLPFLDICSFNVYLESEKALRQYLARLQNLAADKPLLMAEIGLDSQRNGEQAQATQLERQIQTVFSQSCAGAFVFAWTDAWYRGGVNITDWDFGLCTRDRHPKPALKAVRHAYANIPFSSKTQWPSISVIVCSYNGESTIRDTLNGLITLDYPDYEVIVVDDGSTDETAAIVAEYDVVSISTENRGLSNARNTGWQAASGEIIAYIDDDAFPDSHWLKYLADAFLSSDCAAIGGWSPAPGGDGAIADCVANAPGRPIHILLTDTEAEHIPGCNMAFKREVLQEIGGFDPRFCQAGDDVDICWSILERGWSLGFQAGAVNWHHSRNSIKAYWKQQAGYGRAEALLEEKWPQKYNSFGQSIWKGRIYSEMYSGLLTFNRSRIYQGKWGLAPFQSIYTPATSAWSSLFLMPECFFIVGLLACLTILGFFWPPLLLALPLLILSLFVPIVQAVSSSWKARFPTLRPKSWQRFGLKGITTLLILIQPLARLLGRLQHGLTPWRRRVGNGTAATGKLKRSFTLWSEKWLPPAQWLGLLEDSLNSANIPLLHCGDYDAWDMEIRGGLLGGARLLMALEEHGSGKQNLKIDVRPRMSGWAVGGVVMFGATGCVAMFDGALIVSAILMAIAVLILFRFRYEALTAVIPFDEAFKELEQAFQEAGNG